MTTSRNPERQSLDNPAARPLIYSLPPELLALIYGYLDLDAVIALSLSCRKFYLSGPPVSHLLNQLRLSTEPHLRFAWICLRENINNQASKSLICSACRIEHLKAFFSSEEARKSPQHRECAGRKGRINITPDHSMSFDELIQGPTHLCSGFSFNFITHYQDSPWSTESPRIYVPDSNNALSSRGKSYSGFSLLYYWRFVFDKSRDILMQSQGIKMALDESVISFCPHSKSNDANFVKATQKVLIAYFVRGNRYSRKMVKCSFCGMRAVVKPLLFEYGASNDGIIVRVERSLGYMKSPTDPRWLASIENLPIDVPKPGIPARIRNAFSKRR